jgi:hypothetical protein
MAEYIKLRNGTASAWDSAAPTLLQGEVGLETDTRRIKVGDGSTAWASLSYWNYPKMAAKSADYTITDDDADVFEITTGATDRTVTLPTLADNAGRIITVIKVDSASGTVTVDGEGAETIDGETSYVLPSQYNRITVLAGTSSWVVMDLKANYDAGWVANSDWTDLTATVTHNLGAPLSELSVRVFVSSDGTEANSRETGLYAAYNNTGPQNVGMQLVAIDDDSFTLQTGADGFWYITSTGSFDRIDTESWYYRVVVYRLS